MSNDFLDFSQNILVKALFWIHYEFLAPEDGTARLSRKVGKKLIAIIIIIIIINCNWVVTRWQWLFYMYTNMR
jgi:hypothetical protein